MGWRAAFAVVVLAACFKPATAPQPEPPRNDVAPIEIKRTGSDYSATVADPLGFLPIDSEIVMSLDVEQLRGSGLWRFIEPRLTAASGSTLSAFRAMCGIDPVTSIRGLSFGFKNLETETPDGVLVVSGLDRQKLSRCMDRAKSGGKRMTIDKGIVTIMSDTGAPQIAFAFADESTVVAMMGQGSGASALAEILARGSPLRSSPMFMEMFQLTDIERALWGMMNGSSKVFDKTASLGFKPKALFGGIGLLADGLTGSVRVRFGDPAQPASIASMVQAQIGGVRSMFDRLDVTSADNDLVLDIDMSEQQVETLANLMSGAFAP